MPFILLALPVLMIAGGAVLYWPQSFARQQEQLPSAAFVERYPQFAWLKADWLIDLGVWALMLLGLAVGIVWRQAILSLILLSWIFSGLAAANGLLTARTGVCRVPSPRMRYRYCYAPDMRPIGGRQAVLGLALMAAAGLLALL